MVRKLGLVSRIAEVGCRNGIDDEGLKRMVTLDDWRRGEK